MKRKRDSKKYNNKNISRVYGIEKRAKSDGGITKKNIESMSAVLCEISTNVYIYFYSTQHK